MSLTATVEQPRPVQEDEIELTAIQQHENAASEIAASMTPKTTAPTAQEAAEPMNVVEDESQYPTGFRFWIIILSISLSVTLGGFDSQVISTAVPAITDHFHTVQDVGWYVSVYRLGMCSLQFTFGKLYKVFDLKQILIPCTLVFMLGNLLCALAPTSAALVAGRAVCGAAGSGLIAGSYAALASTLPLRRRPLWLGILVAVEGVSYTGAPIVAGLILSRLSWRWCFWINQPIAALTVVTFIVGLPRTDRNEDLTWKQKLAGLDYLGTATLISATASLFIALNWAGTRYPWSSPVIIGLLATSVVLFAAFAYVQYRLQDDAILPPRILRHRTVIASFLYSVCNGSSIQIVEYYLPSYLQVVRNRTPLQSSVWILPLVIAQILGSLLQGSGTTLVGYYVPFAMVGSILMPVFAGLMTTIKVSSPLAKLALYSGFLGFGSAIGYQVPQIAVQTVLPQADANIGLGIILFANQFAPAVFLTAAQNIFTGRLAHNLEGSHLNFTAASIENSGLTGLKSGVPASQLDVVLDGIDISLSQTWYISVALACLTIIGCGLMEWRHIRVKQS